MSAKTSLQELHHDKRGAIMLIGLCMSCFLIGSLWFLIGIGDAIVFRDNMQEATDHATFTSAVLHAKGMNFISACNLILLALITVHILLGIVHDVTLAACIIAFWTCPVWINARRVYTAYSKLFKPAAGAIHYAEVAAANGYPLLAAYKGYRMGADYGEFSPKKRDINMIVISPSIIPGRLLTSGLNAAITRSGKGPAGADGKPTDDKSLTSSSAKKGLPVEAKKFSALCEKFASEGIEAAFSLAGKKSGRGVGTVKGWLKGIFSLVIKVRYCNDLSGDAFSVDLGKKIGDGNEAIAKENADREKSNASLPKGQSGQPPLDAVAPDSAAAGGSKCMKDGSVLDPGFDKWWGCDGPLLPWGGSENGSPWMHVWGINFRPDFNDNQEHRVAVGQRKLGVTSSAKPNMYFSQAEFYFDCKEEWDNEECNKDDNAGYSIQWRARLRRLKFPQIGSLISSFAGEFLGGLKAYEDLKKVFSDAPKAKDAAGNVIPGQAPSLATSGFEKLVETTFEEYVAKPIKGGINSAGGGADKLLDFDFGAYH